MKKKKIKSKRNAKAILKRQIAVESSTKRVILSSSRNTPDNVLVNIMTSAPNRFSGNLTARQHKPSQPPVIRNIKFDNNNTLEFFRFDKCCAVFYKRTKTWKIFNDTKTKVLLENVEIFEGEVKSFSVENYVLTLYGDFAYNSNRKYYLKMNSGEKFLKKDTITALVSSTNNRVVTASKIRHVIAKGKLFFLE